MKRSISLRKLWTLYNKWENCITPDDRLIYHNYFPYYVISELKKLSKK